MKTIKEEKLCEYRNDARRAVRKILTKHQARYRWHRSKSVDSQQTKMFSRWPTHRLFSSFLFSSHIRFFFYFLFFTIRYDSFLAWNEYYEIQRMYHKTRMDILLSISVFTGCSRALLEHPIEWLVCFACDECLKPSSEILRNE